MEKSITQRIEELADQIKQLSIDMARMLTQMTSTTFKN